ncbi:histidine kinase OS=Streptomyces microflavus OX=1919 GN=Smic_09600 PE=4 SV=1 [Streptomyces microflavus]
MSEGWRIAPTFVQAGLDTQWLEQVAVTVDAEILPGALGWLRYTVGIELLMAAMNDWTPRISHLVDAAKPCAHVVARAR